MTLIFKITGKGNGEKIKKAAEIIISGGVVICPTDTSYGIAADATNATAIRKVYALKKRDASKPMHILVSDMAMMEKYGHVTECVRYLVKRFMPGPLTIVVDKKLAIPGALNPKEVAFRIPASTIALEIIKAAGKPITATSANISGQEPLYNVSDVIGVFGEKVDAIVDAGDLPRVAPSTFVDVRGGKASMLREGPISIVAITKAMEEFRKTKILYE